MLEFGFRKWKDGPIYLAKTKALISCTISAQRICAYVFAYATDRLSYDSRLKKRFYIYYILCIYLFLFIHLYSYLLKLLFVCFVLLGFTAQSTPMSFHYIKYMHVFILLAHLSRRLIGELIVYPWSGGRRTSSFVRPSTMLKHLLRNRLADRSQILCGASFGRGNEILFAASGSHDQDGRHAHTW